MGSHAESSCQESFRMRIILLLTVFTTLGLCQRQSPPRTPLTEPPQGQRCAGRNFNGRRCCTPESPCGYGEGDCDGPLDGGANDGHRGCQGDLVCGSNNCKKFGTYFHEKDDCCDLPETLAIPEPLPLIPAGVPLEPPAGGSRGTPAGIRGRGSGIARVSGRSQQSSFSWKYVPNFLQLLLPHTRSPWQPR